MNANPAVYRENLCFQDREIHHKSFVTECVTKNPHLFQSLMRYHLQSHAVCKFICIYIYANIHHVATTVEHELTHDSITNLNNVINWQIAFTLWCIVICHIVHELLYIHAGAVYTKRT